MSPDFEISRTLLTKSINIIKYEETADLFPGLSNLLTPSKRVEVTEDIEGMREL